MMLPTSASMPSLATRGSLSPSISSVHKNEIHNNNNNNNNSQLPGNANSRIVFENDKHGCIILASINDELRMYAQLLLCFLRREKRVRKTTLRILLEQCAHDLNYHKFDILKVPLQSIDDYRVDPLSSVHEFLKALHAYNPRSFGRVIDYFNVYDCSILMQSNVIGQCHIIAAHHVTDADIPHSAPASPPSPAPAPPLSPTSYLESLRRQCRSRSTGWLSVITHGRISDVGSNNNDATRNNTSEEETALDGSSVSSNTSTPRKLRKRYSFPHLFSAVERQAGYLAKPDRQKPAVASVGDSYDRALLCNSL